MQALTRYLSIAFTALIQGGMALFAVYLSAQGYPIEKAVLSLSLMGFGGLLGSLLGGVLTDCIQSRTLGILFSVLWMVVPWGLGTHHYGVICWSAFMAGMALAALRSIYLVMITQQFHEKHLEMRLSQRRLILNLGVAAGSAMMGYLLKYAEHLFSSYFLLVGTLP